MVGRVFDRGDVVRVCLNPVSGNEIQGDFRPCLVLSTKAFNRLGLALIVPITQGGNYARVHGFTIPLIGTGMDTQGVVVVNSIKSLDLKARQAKFVEKASQVVVDDALAKLQAILE
ncbi:MAG: type II toxin-antitoxin system ChpB family toxin [Hydrogenovibrio crunogenus]|nr:type II toxin-antitoxin system ChpB family toxin [Hydrogenovibrio crunogenus]